MGWIQIQVLKEVFQLDWASGHAMRLNSRTGTEGLPVSSLNCDRPLHSGIRAPETVMSTGGQITDGVRPYAPRRSL